MLQHLDHSRKQMTHDWYLVDGNNRYIQYWSLAQCIVVIISSVLQVHIVKNFFGFDSTSSKGKPRA